MPDKITFFERFEVDILSGKKTITIRDESERFYKVGSIVDVSTFEDNRHFAKIGIDSVSTLIFDELNARHAEQENMTLVELKSVISEIYPGVTQFYVIEFHLI